MKDPRSSNGTGGHSRRAFLKGTSAAAAATAFATGAGAAVAAEAESKVVGPGATPVTLNINGKNYELKVEPRMTLLEVLRWQLDLTGAKPVSVDASSGAATVIIDGKPAAANTTLAVACAGKKIQTVESLGGAKPDPVRDGVRA